MITQEASILHIELSYENNVCYLEVRLTILGFHEGEKILFMLIYFLCRMAIVSRTLIIPIKLLVSTSPLPTSGETSQGTCTYTPPGGNEAPSPSSLDDKWRVTTAQRYKQSGSLFCPVHPVPCQCRSKRSLNACLLSTGIKSPSHLSANGPGPLPSPVNISLFIK